MKTIEIDEVTFATLWSRFQPGDKSEDDILRRVLGLTSSPSTRTTVEGIPPSTVGYTDRRFGVQFAQGFEIFRTYKQQQYKAVAEDGHWRMSDGRVASSLNQLSMMVGATTENAWTGWNYRDGTQIRTISELRDPSTVTKRN